MLNTGPQVGQWIVLVLRTLLLTQLHKISALALLHMVFAPLELPKSDKMVTASTVNFVQRNCLTSGSRSCESTEARDAKCLAECVAVE